MNHYLAKFVILLNNDHGMERALMDIKYYFEHVLIMQYLVVIHSKEQGTVFEIGYFKENKFRRVNQTVDFESILKAQLKDLTLRAIVIESIPYSYRSYEEQLVGLDIEIAQIIAHMMGVGLSVTQKEAWNTLEILNLLYDQKIDIYLTRRGYNPALTFPQLHLQDRFTVRLMMPKIDRINFNLQFLKPYKQEVWYLLLLLLTIACTLNWFFWKRMSINVVMVIIFGYSRKMGKLTAILVVVIQFLKFILLEAYLGQVTSFMIRLRYQENPQTLEQFFDSSILLNAPEIMEQFLNHLPTNLSTALMKKLRKDSPFKEWAGYEPGFAYIVTEYASDAMKNAFSYESMFNATDFYIMEEPLYELGVCYLFGMWSKFIVKFKECLERLYETGIFIKLTNDAWRFANRALKANSSTVLMFPDLVPVFFFLCYGWALSGVCFVAEISLQMVRIIIRRNMYRIRTLIWMPNIVKRFICRVGESSKTQAWCE
ncbi:uncharacterized protein LOC125771978 [Anopheles funestus]|uniref:uncharacterized protein LOC125771978 n=1 Tax=Anopheles funestus TaxID=62324 RepID=UPI0020C5B615|nr:uncharacterized protein LOC125771978 [Anopheles funestus]